MAISKNITVIVNKSWETEPLLNALTNRELIAKIDLLSDFWSFPKELNSPKNLTDYYDEKRTSVRARFQLKDYQHKASLNVSVWCIEDLMHPDKCSSSSEEKFNVLPLALVDNPDLVISVSTANCPYENSMNGSVFIGAESFLFNGCPDNPESKLNPEGALNTLMPSNVNAAIFTRMNDLFDPAVIDNLLTPPNSPATQLGFKAASNISVVSSINVTDYHTYSEVDEAALKAFNDVEGKYPDAIETTHGVVKLRADEIPILFISPITDRFGHFDDDVTPQQNYVAAFNAGVVLQELLYLLHEFVADGNEFAEKRSIPHRGRVRESCKY